MEKGGCIYFMTNRDNKVLYIGVTSDLKIRLYQHKNKEYPKSFTAKYNCNKLVYFESFQSIEEAIAQEKRIKDWKRVWKNELISKTNPTWEDLSADIESW